MNEKQKPVPFIGFIFDFKKGPEVMITNVCDAEAARLQLIDLPLIPLDDPGI